MYRYRFLAPGQRPALFDSEWRLRIMVVGVVLMAAAAGIGGAKPILLLLVAFAALGLALKWPELRLPGLILAAAFVPFSIDTGTASRVNIVMIAVVALWGLRLTEMLFSGRVRLPESPMNRPWLWLLSVASLSLVAGEAMRSPWLITKEHFLYVQLAQLSLFLLSAFTYWITITDIPHRSQVQRVVNLLVGLGVLLIALLLAPPGVVPMGTRFLLMRPIFRLCIIGLCAGFALFGQEGARRSRIGLGMLAILLVVVPWWRYNDWISGWLPGVAALVIALMLWLFDRRMRATLICVGFLGLAGTALLATSLASTEIWSVSTRIMAWRTLVDLMSGHWLFGMGLASYGHYWTSIIGFVDYLDPTTGLYHFSYEPKVNMHNNFIDIVAQMGFLGLACFLWLLSAYGLQAWAAFRCSSDAMVRTLAAACLSVLAGMIVSGNLGDWLIPFVYNIGVAGFRDSFFVWMLPGLLVLSQRAETETEPATNAFASTE